MATIVLQKAWIAKTISGNPMQIIEFPEGTSLAVKAGEFVYLSAGYVTEIGDAPALILGMATTDGQDTTAGLYEMGVYVANSDTIFTANEVSDNAGSGTGGTGVATAVGHIGIPMGLYRDTTLNITHITRFGGNHRVITIDFDHRDAIGDTGGRLLFQIRSDYRQLFSTS